MGEQLSIVDRIYLDKMVGCAAEIEKELCAGNFPNIEQYKYRVGIREGILFAITEFYNIYERKSDDVDE